MSEIEKSFVAHRVSDTAQASSSTEPPSAVTSAPSVNETRELPNVTGRSYADAPEIDGSVRLLPPDRASKTLKVGEFTRARIVATDGHDLIGAIV